MRRIPHDKHQKGFTIVELLVISPVILITIATFIGVLIFITGEVLVARSHNVVALNTKSALEMIERDVKASSNFLATNSVSPIVSPQGRNNDAVAFVNSSAAASNSTLILYTASTTGGPQWDQYTPVWRKDSPAACSSTGANRNSILMYDIVYFVADNTLWRRTIMPSNYRTAACAIPEQRPSCHPDRPTNTTCVARDVRVLDNVTLFDLQHFTTAASTSPIAQAQSTSSTDAARQTLLNNSDTVSVRINTSTTVAGRDISHVNSVRTSRLGSLMVAE